MAEPAERIVEQTIDHVIAVLRADLPADLQATTIACYLPGLPSQLPFVSVAAERVKRGAVGLGRVVALKRAPSNSSWVDLGYVTASAGECLFSLSLWTVTRLQLEALREAVLSINWVQREHVWAAVPGALNRTVFRRCRLEKSTAAVGAPLPPAPPHIRVNTDELILRVEPSDAAAASGQAQRGDQFELVGRNADATWVQGCCSAGQPVWMVAESVEVSLPLAAVPVTSASRSAGRRRSARRAADTGGPAPLATRGAVIDPGTAMLAVAASPVTTVWQQELQFRAYLEASEEPTEPGGPPIQEIGVVRHLAADELVLDTERTRLLHMAER